MIHVRHAIWARSLALALLAFTLASQASAQDTEPQADAEAERAFPYVFTAPEDWRTEVVTFPLSFAPELDYEGHGNVRFAPGMFSAGAEDFWTYSFVWWLPADTEISAQRLSADMNAYFSGLAELIMASRELEVPEHKASANFTMRADDKADASQTLSLEGRVETFDAFATQSPVALNAHVNGVPCPDQDRLALIFAFSPQPYAHENWRALEAIRTGFQCGAE